MAGRDKSDVNVLSDKELYKMANDLLPGSDCSDKIDLAYMQEQLDMAKTRKEMLAKHPYIIWPGKDGKWYTYLPDFKKGRVLRKRNTKKAMEDCVVDFWRTHDQVTFGTLFFSWAKEKLEFDIKKQTYDRYVFDYQRFFKGMEIDRVDFRSITEEDLKLFIKRTIKEENLSKKGYNGLRVVLRGTFMYAKEHGYTDISISAFLGDLNLSKKCFRKVVKKKEELVFTADEVKMLEDYIYSIDYSPEDLGILLAFQTGVRVGELAALQWSDLSGEVLHVWKTEVTYKDDDGHCVHAVQESPKTEAGDREVILNSKAQGILKQIRKMNPFGEYMFMKNGKRINEKNFGYRLHVLCKKVGILERSMHKTRSTCATTMLNSGVSESLIILQLGHTSIDVTKSFYYHDNSTFEEAKRQLERAVL